MLQDDILKVDISKEDIRKRDPLALGVVFVEMGFAEYAKEEFEKAKKDVRDPVRARELLGLLYLETGEADSAIDEFMEAIKILNDFSSTSARLYYNLATVYEKMERSDKAIGLYEEAYMRDIYYRDVEKKIHQLREKVV
jgi:tetratricopeptide (TPR) repeat protein